MPDREQRELLHLWNRWREGKPDVKPDLSGLRRDDQGCGENPLTGANLQYLNLRNVNFTHTDLKGANLQGANLQGANLQGAELQDADLTEAELNRAILRDAKLHRAILKNAKFEKADLHGAEFREADLEKADLENARGLSEEYLAGANLKDATLPLVLQPERIRQFDHKFNQIDNASQNLQTLFFILLAACMYCLLTIASTTHAHLIADTTPPPLPIIGAKVSIFKFYWIMPLILLIFYLYFHQNLQRLWVMIASLPIVFPDGSSLGERSEPRHASGFIRTRSYILKENSSPGEFLYGLLFVFLSWYSVPMTLIYFWWTFLPRRDRWGDITTVYHIILITITVAFGLWIYQQAIFTLQTSYKSSKKQSNRGWLVIYNKVRKCDYLLTPLVIIGCILIILDLSFLILDLGFSVTLSLIIAPIIIIAILYFGIFPYNTRFKNVEKENPDYAKKIKNIQDKDPKKISKNEIIKIIHFYCKLAGIELFLLSFYILYLVSAELL